MENIYENRVIPFKYLPEFRAHNCRTYAALSYTGDLIEFIACRDGYEIAVFDYVKRGDKMQTTADLETRLKEELEIWIRNQCREEYEDFYLWFRPTADGSSGEIRIATDRPAHDYQLAMPERINKGATVNQNFNRIRLGILRTLPVLS